MNTYSEKSFVSKTPSISLASSSASSDKSSPPATKKSTVRPGSGSPSSSRGSSRGSSSGSGRTSTTHSSTSTDIYGSYDPFYSQKLIKKEFESESCLRLSNVVAVIGVLSMCIHVVEFFAYTYLLTAYFLIHWNTVPRSTNVWWSVAYPSALIIHTIVQCFLAVLLIIGAIRKKKSYMLPWIIATCIEIVLLAKTSIILAATSDAASYWIIATTVAFMSVQVFYVIIAARLYRRYKREELEVQPPAYTTEEKQPPSPTSSVSNYLYKV